MATAEPEEGVTVPAGPMDEEKKLQETVIDGEVSATDQGPAPEPTVREQQIAIETGSEGEGWYILDETGQHVGPYDVPTLEGYAGYGYVLPESLVWRQGRGDWVAMREVEELASAVAYADAYFAAAATAAAENVQDGDVAMQQAGEGLRDQYAAEPSYKAQQDAAREAAEVDPMAAFKAEISALDGVGNGGGMEEAERVESPEPEDRRFEDDDGTIYVWDPALRKFVEEGMQPGGAGYNVEDMVFEMEEEVIPEYKSPRDDDEDEDDEGPLPSKPSKAVAKAANGAAPAEGMAAAEERGLKNGTGADAPVNGKGKGKGKRTAEDVMEKHKEKAKRAKEAAEKEQTWCDVKVTTSVYVTGLPDDVTEEELGQVFSKCGILKFDDDGMPKVKVYRDKVMGVPKGDGLVTYLKEPSVVLALQILDQAPFRPDMSKKMTVQRAHFQMHGDQFIPRKKPKKKKKKAGGAMVEKMLGWGGFDDVRKATDVTVILKNVFTPDDFNKDFTPKVLEADVLAECTKLGPVDKGLGAPQSLHVGRTAAANFAKTRLMCLTSNDALLPRRITAKVLEAEIFAECTKLGPVDKVRVFHEHPEGVVSVKFKTEEPAAKCVELMNGRFFAERQVEAHMWNGITKYYSKRKEEETEEEQQARLAKYAAELEAAEMDPALAEKLRKEQELTAAEAAAGNRCLPVFTDKGPGATAMS